MPFPCPVGGRHRQSLESSEGQPTNQQPTNQCAHICRPVEPLVHRLIKLGLYVLLRSLRVFHSGSRRVPGLTHVTATPAPPSCMHTGGICNLDQNAHMKPSSSLDNQFRYGAMHGDDVLTTIAKPPHQLQSPSLSDAQCPNLPTQGIRRSEQRLATHCQGSQRARHPDSHPDMPTPVLPASQRCCIFDRRAL